MTTETIAERIRTARTSRGWSQKELATRAGWDARAGGRDQPLEDWADIEIMSAGVVALAALYGQ